MCGNTCVEVKKLQGIELRSSRLSGKCLHPFSHLAGPGHVVSVLTSIYVLNCTCNDLCVLNQTWILIMKPIWSHCIILMWPWIWFAKILLRIHCRCSSGTLVYRFLLYPYLALVPEQYWLCRTGVPDGCELPCRCRNWSQVLCWAISQPLLEDLLLSRSHWVLLSFYTPVLTHEAIEAPLCLGIYPFLQDFPGF